MRKRLAYTIRMYWERCESDSSFERSFDTKLLTGPGDRMVVAAGIGQELVQGHELAGTQDAEVYEKDWNSGDDMWMRLPRLTV